MTDRLEIPAFLLRKKRRTNARKGLKRAGFRRYIIGNVAIDRESPWLFFVRPISFPRVAGFFCQEFRRLRDARKYAEREAGMG